MELMGTVRFICNAMRVDSEFCLFGGVLRDLHFPSETQIKDHDLRLWIDLTLGPEFVQRLGRRLKCRPTAAKGPVEDRHRYIFESAEHGQVDLSMRFNPPAGENVPTNGCRAAIERVLSADVGLSGIAMDSSGQLWSAQDYIDDWANKTLSVRPPITVKRSQEYITRLIKKYPNHRVLSDSQKISIT